MSYNTWGYNAYPPSTSPKPQPANNPFLETSAANRFPPIDPSSSTSPQPSPALGYQISQNQSYGQNYGQPASFQYQQYGGQQQSNYNPSSIPQQQWTSVQPGYNHTGGYNEYSQQSQPQFTGISPNYGQLQSPYPAQQQQFQYTGYPQFQQQQQPQFNAQQYQRNLVNEFDPYNNVSPLANPGSGPSAFAAQQSGNPQYNAGQSQQQQQSYTPSRTGPSGQQHPRDYIRLHKAELESWNAASWKQIISIFQDLKGSWERQRADLQRHLLAGQYLTQDDTAALNAMIKSSESNIDSVTAALLQMQEVNSSYKHSIDAAGKARVREALNAGLSNLPDWP
ncbi:hypothetical protein Clacol_002915 [Clathrus columnatus]|uniref:Uncharacterized protein n=1 Tax=Clathrus columnatus TaxID=1419009 RepID=A0AAV5A6R6_9AGAM|nr:hypothetical protein Clacol_002915 [Clathrus columnatus]